MAETLMSSSFMQSIFNFILKIALKLPTVVRSLVEMSFSDAEYAKSYDLSRITDPMSVEGTGTGNAIMTTHTRGTDFEKLSSLDIPCVIFTASVDKVASADNLKTIIDSAPSDTVVYNFEEGGHMMMEYNPKEVARLSLAVMDKCK